MSSNSESGSDTNMSTRDSGSDLDFNLEEVNEDVFDNDMDLATEEEASAYAEEVEREEQNQQELMRRFSREIFIDSW